MAPNTMDQKVLVFGFFTSLHTSADCAVFLGGYRGFAGRDGSKAFITGKNDISGNEKCEVIDLWIKRHVQ